MESKPKTGTGVPQAEMPTIRLGEEKVPRTNRWLVGTVVLLAVALVATTTWAIVERTSDEGAVVEDVGDEAPGVLRRGNEVVTSEGPDLVAVDPDTGESRRIDLGGVVGDVTSPPVWSPDGSRIVFGARGGSLYSVDVPSGERSLLVRLPGENLDSVDEIEWSPDGAYLVIMNDLVPGGGRLYVMNADGSGVRVLLDDYEPEPGLAWSPDGKSIAYAIRGAGGDDGPDRLWTISPVEGSPFAVAASTHISDPAWSPDGSRIAFIGSTADGRGWFAVEADGTGPPLEIDELTYLSWRGGSVFPRGATEPATAGSAGGTEPSGTNTTALLAGFVAADEGVVSHVDGGIEAFRNRDMHLFLCGGGLDRHCEGGFSERAYFLFDQARGRMVRVEGVFAMAGTRDVERISPVFLVGGTPGSGSWTVAFSVRAGTDEQLWVQRWASTWGETLQQMWVI